MGSVSEDLDINVAVVGGGIAGLTLALGLLKRGIAVKVYERASCFREIGAGIGMSPNAERAMLRLDPEIHAAFKRLATPNTEDWFQYVDGYNQSETGDGEGLLFKVYLGERGFEGCRRTDFLQELAKLLPESCVEFNKNLSTIEEAAKGSDGKIKLIFSDGHCATADVVFGCDGLRSRVRQIVLGESNPASRPSYTHKYAFRGLIPMERAQKALGDDKSSTRYMHLGKNGHVLTFPVAMGSLLNVVAFVTDAAEWPENDKLTMPARREDAMKSFADFGPVVRSIMSLLGDNLDKWAIFDTFDNPAQTYLSDEGRVCLVGDAAHAAAPHHGAGAGLAIEDALVLAVALEDVKASLAQPGNKMNKNHLLRTGLSVYEDIRLERTHWLVESSRYIGELYEWQTPECGSDASKSVAEVEDRCRKIWDYNIDQMVENTKTSLSLRRSESA